MASLAISVAGGFAAMALGPATGLAPLTLFRAGYFIGGLAGTLLGPKPAPQEGPRLSDLNVQYSTYGAPIPIVYGTARTAGTLMWVKNNALDETVIEIEVGKGPGPSESQIQYKYSVTCAIVVCKGPINSIRKIWADTRLIYDTSSTNAGVTGTSANRQIYLGTETQTASSIIETTEGVGNVQGFRGLAYIVLKDFDLTKYGNRIPNFSFEVSANSSATDVINTITKAVSGGGPMALNTTTLNIIQQNTGNAKIVKANYVTGTTSVECGTLGDGGNDSLIYVPKAGEIWSLKDGRTVYRFDDAACTEIGTFLLPTGGLGHRYMAYDSFTPAVWTCSRYSSGVTEIFKTDPDTLTSQTYYLPETCISPIFEESTKSLWVFESGAGPPYNAHKINVENGDIEATVALTGQVEVRKVATNNTGTVWAVNGAGIDKIDSATATVTATLVVGSAASVSYDPVNDYIWVGEANKISAYTAADHTFVRSITLSGASSPDPIEYEPVTHSLWVGGAADFLKVSLDRNATGTTTVSAIVNDILSLVGIPSTDIDSTALTDTVDGFVLASQMSARAAIEELQTAYYFDAVESEYQLKFVKRGGSSVATIQSDDLAAHEPSSDPPDVITITRRQEVELPREVNIAYINKGALYEPGIQQARRIVTQSQQKVTAELSIVLTDNTAAQIANVILDNAYIERQTFRFIASTKYMHLEPTDIVTIVTDSATHIIRIVNSVYSFPGIIIFEGVAEDTSVYSSDVTGAPANPPVESVPSPGGTDLVLLDMPILRDKDDDPGFYMAAAGFGADWSGAVIYVSTDGGATYTQIDSILTAVTMGRVQNLVGSGSTTVFDNGNTITVELANGTLSSDTELNVLNGANPFAFGVDGRWELGHFVTATQNTTTNFTLSKLIRGVRGTEGNIGNHQIGDRFILLSTAALIRIVEQSDQLNLTKLYKGVSIGEFEQNITSKSFINTGIGKKPYAPAHIKGIRDSSNNLTITWLRRTRIAGEWIDYVDTQLGETTEQYQIDIMSGSTVLRTLPTSSTYYTSETGTYTAAQQTTDGLTPGQDVEVNIYQNSSVVGRGYAGNATI